MARYGLIVIPQPAPNSRTVFVTTRPEKDFIFFEGHGPHTLSCGNCDNDLAVGVEAKTLINIVLKCNECGAHNDTGGGLPAVLAN